jgi:shikimate kinase
MFDLHQGQNIYLIGMMGAGKSTIGRLLAKRLGYEFIDTDTEVEQEVGQSVMTFFETNDEDKFRQIETKILAEIPANKRLVVATGGGIVTESENLQYLKQRLTIWIDPTLDILVDRLEQSEQENPNTRPLCDRLPQLYIDRRDLYDEAKKIHIPITSSHQSPPEIMEQIMKQITN